MAIFRYSGNWRSYLEGSSSTVSQNIANNSSVIKVDVWIGMDAGWSIEFGNTYGNTVTVTCDGQSQTLAVGPLSLNGSKKHLGSVQFTVGHTADGSKSAGISLSSNMSVLPACAGVILPMLMKIMLTLSFTRMRGGDSDEVATDEASFVFYPHARG